MFVVLTASQFVPKLMDSRDCSIIDYFCTCSYQQQTTVQIGIPNLQSNGLLSTDIAMRISNAAHFDRITSLSSLSEKYLSTRTVCLIFEYFETIIAI